MDQRDLYLTVLYLGKNSSESRNLIMGLRDMEIIRPPSGNLLILARARSMDFFESLHHAHFHHPECLNLQTILQAVNQLDLGD